MEDQKIDDLVGIYEEDGSVKCRDCMEEEDWEGLTQENIITVEDIGNSEMVLYCNYCEEKL